MAQENSAKSKTLLPEHSELCLTVKNRNDETILSIKSGKRVALLGLNGAGKSTFIRQLIGELFNSDISPCYFLDGSQLFTNAISFKKKLGYQADTMLPLGKMTGREYLKLCAQLKGLENEEITQSIENVDASWQLEKLLSKPLEKLSKGNMQKLAIAQAFLNDPSFLFFDEPCQSLDPIEQEVFNNNLLRLTEFSLCLFSTHNANHGLSVADDIIIIHQSKIAYFYEKNDNDHYLLFCAQSKEKLEKQLKTSEIEYCNLDNGLFKLSTNSHLDKQGIEQFAKNNKGLFEFCLPEKEALMPLFRLLASSEWVIV